MHIFFMLNRFEIWFHRTWSFVELGVWNNSICIFVPPGWEDMLFKGTYTRPSDLSGTFDEPLLDLLVRWFHHLYAIFTMASESMLFSWWWLILGILFFFCPLLLSTTISLFLLQLWGKNNHVSHLCLWDFFFVLV